MLTQEENDRLTRVGPGTPMGGLLRRYWMPIAISAEVTSKRPLVRRLLGEDLVVFRTAEGELGVLDQFCPHRRTSFAIGVSEKTGLRCGYHGWMFAPDGRCIEQPFEPKLNPNMRIKSYPAQEMGGLIFTYMGPAPAPLLPRFDLFVTEGCLRDIGHAMLDFNWLQAMENSVDPLHAQWLHGRFARSVREREGKKGLVDYDGTGHAKIAFDPFEYGIIKRRMLEGGDENDDGWKIGHPLVFPNMVKIGHAGFQQFQIRVPIDDTTTWNIWYTTYWPGGPDIEKQESIPDYVIPLRDSHGERIVDFIDGQDIAAWAEQGPIADRVNEKLSASDRGVLLYRTMLQDQLHRIESGAGDPLGTVRDASINRCIELPVERRKKFAEEETYMLGILEAQAVRYSPLNADLTKLFKKFGSRNWA